ncbi:putative aminopeptidase [Caldisphaera lagunensis DSM 15908]|uniref:Putative aminopeptidase n=1 Tax=Caldisphaera lagunensis (strain DSM 15908 / JCM 11604 / ANMR 0165 / IC-154) TaxID=1056495 RepID=L0AC67_CALLD|nr:M28 family peptidase [Caldisphaera lagunensis]AFZ70722.1 putative aminopeptidase [Caldisphaera lagunensis DSM 15908]
MINEIETLGNLYNKFINYTNDYRVYRFLSNYTRYNRIQGSAEILDAAKFIEKTLIENSPDILNVEFLKFGGTSVPEWIGAPTGWIHRFTWLKIGDVELNSKQHPTLPVAHSPPSDGKVIGKAVKINKWNDPEEYKKAKGKIVVSDGLSYIVYRLAYENGALGVLLYSKNSPPEAVPYKSLFLSREEAAKYTIPAISIPNYLVNDIEDKEVSMYLDADVKKDPGFPYILAWIGDKNSKGPILMAHMCHPSPGANDNGSGTVSLMETAIVLSEMIQKGEIKQPDKTIRFIWFPEYTGSSVVFNSWLSSLVTEAINLDMVGVYPSERDGPLKIISNSISNISKSSAAIYYAAKIISNKMGFDRFLLTPYDGGSDHDVTISYGIPSVMLNQWPDYAYHTDLDDMNRISRFMLKLSSSIASLASYTLTLIDVDTSMFYNDLLNQIIINHLSNNDLISAKLALKYLPELFNLEKRDIDIKIEASGDNIIKNKPPMVEGLRAIAKYNLDASLKISEILNRSPLGTTVYLREAFFLSKERPLKEVYTLLLAEYGKKNVNNEDLINLFNILADAKIISY